MMVSVLAAMQGNPGLAVGNAYGSNIANIGLVLGSVALITPLAVHSSVIRKEMPLLMLCTLVTGWMLLDGIVTRWEALCLLLVLVVFIVVSIIRSRNQSNKQYVAGARRIAGSSAPRWRNGAAAAGTPRNPGSSARSSRCRPRR